MRKVKPKAAIIIPEQPADVYSLTNEGLGVASVDGKTTFIEGALPSEKVKYRLFKTRRHYDEAACHEIITPSSERTTPDCEHFGSCGGCSMQHLENSAQISWKEKILLEQLERLGQVQPAAVIPALFASHWGYRHKARLGARFQNQENKVVVGFRQKFRHHLMDLKQCSVLHPKVGKNIEALGRLISDLSCKDQLPQIEVSIGDDEAALIFRHLVPFTSQDLDKLRNFGSEYQIHIYLQPNPPEAISKLWPAEGPERIAYRLPDFQIEMLFHPSDFTQIHLEMNRLMVKQALNLLDPHPDEKVLDLFCGIGNFSLALARFARQVVGIEGSQIMVERAYENAKHNAIANADFYAANLFEPNQALNSSQWLHQSYEKILLDPPRTGAKEIIEHFPKLSPKRIVYVSCNPATLARDANILVHQQSYRLTQAGMMNMFPHTNHIEAMAVFER